MKYITKRSFMKVLKISCLSCYTKQKGNESEKIIDFPYFINERMYIYAKKY